METTLKNSRDLIDKLNYKELISLRKVLEEKIIEFKREQILRDAEISIEEYKNGKIKALNYDELIEELNN